MGNTQSTVAKHLHMTQRVHKLDPMPYLLCSTKAIGFRPCTAAGITVSGTVTRSWLNFCYNSRSLITFQGALHGYEKVGKYEPEGHC